MEPPMNADERRWMNGRSVDSTTSAFIGAHSRLRFRLAHVWQICSLALASLVLNAPVAADPVKGIRSRNEQPLAIRGGVLLLPLVADKPGDHWPATVELTLADRTKIQGQIAWMTSAPPRADRRWTDDPRGLTIRAIQPEDDSTSVGSGNDL